MWHLRNALPAAAVICCFRIKHKHIRTHADTPHTTHILKRWRFCSKPVMPSIHTRKQRWRRVRRTKRATTETQPPETTPAAACGGGIKNSTASSLNTDTVGPLQQRYTSVPSKDSKGCGDATATTSSNAVGASVKSPSTKKIKDASGTRVRFNHQVRVILVPCARELRDLSTQLWWGPGDYLNFR